MREPGEDLQPGGCVEVLPMPTRAHQRIVRFLFSALQGFLASAPARGEVLFAPLPLRLRAGCYREPELIFVRTENAAALAGRYLEGADLVMEVVSEADPDRDWVLKRKEYAEAGIPEYWIVDPFQHRVAVDVIRDGEYVVHGDFRTGQAAASATLPGFTVKVDAVFAAAGDRGAGDAAR